jgi:hypothetical protein
LILVIGSPFEWQRLLRTAQDQRTTKISFRGLSHRTTTKHLCGAIIPGGDTLINTDETCSADERLTRHHRKAYAVAD